MTDQTRNINAHAAARLAACLWSDRYASQTGGLMDFWDKLTLGEKRTAAREVKKIREARPYTGKTP